jgi:hypothetical protein
MNTKGRHAWILIAVLLAASAAYSMQHPQKSVAPDNKKPAAAASTAPAGVKYDPGNHPDPFFNPNLFKMKSDDPNEEEPRGQPPPGITGMSITQVKLLGTVEGDGTPTAVFLGTDRRSYFLQESDRLYDGYLKQIGPDSVILVRETRIRSGKILTQEVTKRLRTP